MAMTSNPRYTNIARPYALAAFDYAREHQQLSEWNAFLTAAAMAVENADIKRLLPNPEISVSQWFDLLSGVLASQLDAERKNFLHLITQNKRLVILPEIATLFAEYLAQLEKMSTVRVVTAIEISEEYRRLLTQALAKRIQHDVTLQCEVNPSIIGGAIFHLGDKVIDGSVLGKLNRLLESSLG